MRPPKLRPDNSGLLFSPGQVDVMVKLRMTLSPDRRQGFRDAINENLGSGAPSTAVFQRAIIRAAKLYGISDAELAAHGIGGLFQFPGIVKDAGIEYE